MSAFELLAGHLRAHLLFRACERGIRLFAQGYVRVVALGKVQIGERTRFMGGVVPTELVSDPGSEIAIGERTVFNYGVSVRAVRRIRIGSDCLFGAMVRVRDSDGITTAPVVIGDGVWLSHGAIIEPGVTVGDGAIVAAGSVVFHDVPPRSLASGNPAVSMPLEPAPHQPGGRAMAPASIRRAGSVMNQSGVSTVRLSEKNG